MATLIFYTLIIALSAHSQVLAANPKISGKYAPKLDSKSAKKYLAQNLPDITYLRRSPTNGTTMKPPSMEVLCYVGHMKCDRNTFRRSMQTIVKRKQVCAYQKTQGLINFQNPCDIALQNCLYKVQENKTGKVETGLFYYNDKSKACQYYLKLGGSVRNAINLYYIDGLNLGIYSKEFEKVDKNSSSYDFLDLVYA